MSIINGIIDFTSGIENAVGSEVRKIGSDLSAGVSQFESQLSSALESQFSHLRELADAGKADIEVDLKDFGDTLAVLKNQGETLIDGVFHEAVSRVKALTDEMKSLSIRVIDGASTATTYVRTTARNDIDGAISDAKKAFDKIENDFKTRVSGVSNTFLDFTKGEIDKLVSQGKSDLTNLDTLKKDITTKLSSTIDSIKGDLETAKSDLSKALDDVISFAKSEMSKLETRLSSFASGIDKAATNVAVGLLVASVGFFVFEVVRKNMAKDEAEAKVKLRR